MNTALLQRIALLLILAIASIYIVMSIEFYQEQKDIGEGKEVHQQPYLAAQTLLQKFGVKTVAEDDYRRLFSGESDEIRPTLDDAIVLVNAQAAISPALANELIDWVSKGGFLILSVNAEPFQQSFRGNALLKQLGVSVNWLVDDADSLKKYQQVVSKLKDPDSHNIEISLESAYRITLPEDREIYYSVSNDEGNTLIQLEQGEGMITLMTETQIWNNWQLDEDDNAIILLGFLQNNSQVYFLNPVEQPHWFILLYRYSAAFIWLLALLIISGIWHLGSRFGPKQSLSLLTQSRFIDHIKVAGDYYWQHDNQQIMLLEVRRIIFHHINQKWPSLHGADQNKIVAHMAELSSWPADTITKLMFENSTLNQSQFTQWMKGLQQLRKIL